MSDTFPSHPRKQLETHDVNLPRNQSCRDPSKIVVRFGIALMSCATTIPLSLSFEVEKEKRKYTDLRRNRSATHISPTADEGTF